MIAQANDPQPIRLGLVGLGNISRFYVAAIEATGNCQLVAALDTDASVAERFEEDNSGIAVVSSLEQMQELGVDAVFVTTPPVTHHQICIDALRLGFDVCCEKPLTLNVADGAELIDLASHLGRVVMGAYHRRYNVNLLGVKTLVGISSVTARYNEDIFDHSSGEGWYFSRAETGGGCLADNGPNVVDALYELVGPLVLRSATTQRIDGYDVVSRIEANAVGCSVVIELSWNSKTEEKTVELEYYDGSIVVIDFLEGFPGFKNSLAHEYEGVISDFESRIRQRNHVDYAREMFPVSFISDAVEFAAKGQLV